MVQKFWRLDKWSADNFRAIECFGPVWHIDHYFLRPEEIEDPWLRAKPVLDLDLADCRFREKPKAKKIPELTMAAGLLYMNGRVFDEHFCKMIGDFVTAMPIKIGSEPFYIIRPDVVIDCVDLKRSEWLQRDDGYRYSWQRLVLRDVPADTPPIFRPAQGREFWVQPVFADRFVKTCETQKVVSINFEEVFPVAHPVG